MQAIFMVGEQRSGSNLLRLILNESPDIAGPHPPHILQRMMPLVPFYGDLRDEARFMRMVDDICRLVELNPVPWDGVAFDRQDVRSRCRENSLVAVYGAVMDIYAESLNAKAWICKSMQNIRWASDLEGYFDKPKYVYLYRDPRDVTLSFLKAVVGDKHAYFIVQQWAELQRLCLSAGQRLGPSQVFSLCYEDLTSKPKEVVQRLCKFLDIEFNEKMLAFHESGEAKRTAASSQLWENVTQPIMSSNSKKFMKEMSEEDIRIVESVAGDVMDALGYERVFVKPGQELKFSREDIARFQEENDKRKKLLASKTDPEDRQRRQRQEKVLEEIRAMAN